MSRAVERSDARSWADADLDPLFDGAFPAFIVADPRRHPGYALHRPVPPRRRRVRGPWRTPGGPHR